MDIYRIFRIHEVNGVLRDTLVCVTHDIFPFMRATGLCGDRKSTYRIYKNWKLVMISKHLGA